MTSPEAPQTAEELLELRRTVRGFVDAFGAAPIRVDCDIKRRLQDLTDMLRAALRALTVCVRVELPDGSGFETGAANGLSNNTHDSDQIRQLLDAVPLAGSTLTPIQVPKLNGAGRCNALLYPIFSEGREVGYFVAAYKTDTLPTQSDGWVLQVAANQIPILFQRHKEHDAARKLAGIVESARDPIISKTLDGRVTSWNPAAEELFGYTAAEMIGQPILRIIPRERLAEEDEILNRLRAGQSIEHYETVRLTKTSQGVAVEITVSPIKNSAGAIVGATKIVHDITERKQAEQALVRAQKQLQEHAATLEKTVEQRTVKLREMVDELQQLSYTIAHDMRAPLRAMATFAQLLLDQSSGAGASSQSQQYCHRIVVAASRLDQLIHDVLSYSKALLQDLPLQPVDLSTLLRDLVDTYPNLHPDKVDICIEGDLPVVWGNESLLTQCFSNLLGNAVKFVAPGTRPEVRICADTAESVARVWIHDNGIGIPKHAQPRLFRMFQKLDNKYEGTGIGLAIVRKVAERMGGKVGVESEIGEGSRFWVELPMASRPPEVVTPDGRRGPMRGPTS